MSRLIFEGNTTKRFGEKIPRPFIEQVRAYDNGVEVDIAFYFKVPNDDDSVEAFLSSLESGALSQTIVLSAITENTLNTLKSNKNFNVLSESFLEESFNMEDAAFARRRTISISDFINGNSTPPPPPVQTPRNLAEYLDVGAESGVGYRVGMNTGTGMDSGISARAGTRENQNKVAMGAFSAPGVTIGEAAAIKYSSYNVAIKDDFYNQEGTRFMKIFGTLQIDYNASDEMYITCFVKND